MFFKTHPHDKIIEFVLALHESNPQEWTSGIYRYTSYRETKIHYNGIVGNYEIAVKDNPRILLTRRSHKKRAWKLLADHMQGITDEKINKVTKDVEDIARSILNEVSQAEKVRPTR